MRHFFVLTENATTDGELSLDFSKVANHPKEKESFLIVSRRRDKVWVSCQPLRKQEERQVVKIAKNKKIKSAFFISLAGEQKAYQACECVRDQAEELDSRGKRRSVSS